MHTAHNNYASSANFMNYSKHIEDYRKIWPPLLVWIGDFGPFFTIEMNPPLGRWAGCLSVSGWPHQPTDFDCRSMDSIFNGKCRARHLRHSILVPRRSDIPNGMPRHHTVSQISKAAGMEMN
jgi:hypothetical protein